MTKTSTGPLAVFNFGPSCSWRAAKIKAPVASAEIEGELYTGRLDDEVMLLVLVA
jgi:hypothetical protein